MSGTDSETNNSLDESTIPTSPESPSCSPSSHNGLLDDFAHDSCDNRALPLLEDANLNIRPRFIRSICFVGAGYVGGPTAALIAFHNPHLRVTVVDKDDRRIRRWNSRHLPIYEPGLADIVRVARDGLQDPKEQSGASEEVGIGVHCRKEQRPSSRRNSDPITSARRPNLFFSADVSRWIGESEIVVIAVNTPTKMRGAGKGSATDMTSFEAVAADVVRHARDGTIIVEKSTVPCRTAEMIQGMINIQRPGAHFEILSNPEFLAAGTAVQDLLQPDRVIIGSATTVQGRSAAETLAAVYASWVDRSRLVTVNVWSSELAKLVANSMLAQRLSSINSISAICEATGAEINEVSAAIGTDSRLGNKFLRAGIGFGGSCFKKDVLSLVYLAESLGLHDVGEYWRQVVNMNEYQRNRFSTRVIRRLNSTLVTKKITVLGYAFKKNTSDTREAPALEIIKTLLDENPREIAIFDPCCNPFVIESEMRAIASGPPVLRDDGGCVKIYSDAYEACAGANAILIVTDFDEFRNAPVPREVSKAGRSRESPAAAAKPVPRGLEIPESVRRRFQFEPDCAADCPDCHSGTSYCEAVAGVTDTPKEQLDWTRVSAAMESPKWLFDGRCIIDVPQMAQLGIRVESIGSAGLGL
ncbi:UDP-glucose 6-dehydrogenase [Penicillium hispanicum]|uniref:UDP-glucose 6-dehydrogenase n=1 Tax=Penicillium hispanicum TaxID=1080232 RepID=UPI0025411FC0|nr:UDP-glucose 6-dehydrogenase [Penicillium hispanicum]KAJ5584026.1 UDP-glucose 6-dehydrogenase [Penicillium hispanicum]